MKLPTILFALAISLLSMALAEPCSVVSVVDGDTLHVRRADGSPLTVRLAEIDAPEAKQPCGPWATALLRSLVSGGHVDVSAGVRDSYGRRVAHVTVGGRDVGLVLLRSGAAWVFVRYPHTREASEAEAAARAARAGLWASQHPIAPWEWRKGAR